MLTYVHTRIIDLHIHTYMYMLVHVHALKINMYHTRKQANTQTRAHTHSHTHTHTHITYSPMYIRVYKQRILGSLGNEHQRNFLNSLRNLAVCRIQVNALRMLYACEVCVCHVCVMYVCLCVCVFCVYMYCKRMCMEEHLFYMLGMHMCVDLRH